jgi:hypothetical protein
MKDETRKQVFVETSDTGLFGPWTRPGGESAIIQRDVEGPAAYWDNTVPGRVHLLLDFYGGDGYRLFESEKPGGNGAKWVASKAGGFPGGLRHGSVLPVNGRGLEGLRGRWG